CLSDWSSDVCSSDLKSAITRRDRQHARRMRYPVMIASIRARSSALSCQAAAFAFVRTWLGLLAPAITDATGLCESNQEKANSRMEWPFDSANSMSDSTIARFSSVKTLG